MGSYLKYFLSAFLLSTFLLAGSVSAQAQNTLPSSQKNAADEADRYTSVRIIEERNALSPGDEILLATQIDMTPHWHVYWKNPGDSGLPVKITWETPDGFEITDIEWPVPDKISYDILVNYGYYDQVTLLQTLKPPSTLPEGEITLTANINMLVCNEICIPESDQITVTLNDPDNLKAENKALMAQAQTKLPVSVNGTFTHTEDEKLLRLNLTPEDRTILKDATEDNLEFFPYDWGIINHVAMPDVQIKDGTVTIAHERGDADLAEYPELSGVLAIKGGKGENIGYALTSEIVKDNAAPPVAVNPENSVETNGTAQPDKTAPTETGINDNAPHGSTTWFGALLFALFGGLILNLMPCVFPVLSMKALSLVKLGDKEQKLARKHGIAYTLGVVLSFLAIGGLLVGLKEAGSVIGWGFQLQNPIVVTALAYLLFVIGLNLIGFFEFGFGLSNVGQKLTRGQSTSSSFFTGTLATIVATPCTAPFMGAAMGFAMTQPPIVSLSVFATLGFGLALPYLILSFIPQARCILPKPGAWMNTFKQFLAFPMFASAIWLVWVMSQQAGPKGVLLVLLGMLAIAFAVWLSHLKNQGVARGLTRTALILSLIIPLVSLAYIQTTDDHHSSQNKTYQFGESFTHDKLSTLLEGDAPIFTEMTAAWCITCKLNHAVAINIQSTKELFQNKNVHYLIGDWTNRDDEITAYLDAFDRNGVPLYVYYGPRDPETGKRPDAKILPQVLTPSIVQKSIKE